MSRRRRNSAVSLGLAATLVLVASGDTNARTGDAKTPAAAPADSGELSIKKYFAELERLNLVDIDTGSKQTLARDLANAEKLLRQGAYIDAAVALFTIVESPRYAAFDDFVEYQNAEYYLAVALANAGAYQTALGYLIKVLNRGPNVLYWAPAHRRAVDIALESRDYDGVLGMLEGLKLNQPIPPGANGERAYLRARIAYKLGQFDKAEGELARISRKSRLFSSALYLRGVIRARKQQWVQSAEALCEIAQTPDDDKFTFVVDNRYFKIKDLARLGLGRLAHEKGEYDDAYYHYFQIPSDSDRLPEALFEAAWSMYQKRELGTARDLVSEFLRNFPTAPQMPEARLLAGYIELADCKFDDAQKKYDTLVKDLQPLVDQLDRVRKSRRLRTALYTKALRRYRAERADPSKRLAQIKKPNPTQAILGLLRVDPKFVRLHDAISGLRRAKGDAPHVVRAWRSLSRRVSGSKVKAGAADKTVEEEDLADATSLAEDVRRLRRDISRAKARLSQGLAARQISADVAAEERKRLDALDAEVAKLQGKAWKAVEAADAEAAKKAAPALAPMLRADLAKARKLRTAASTLQRSLDDAADKLATRRLNRMYKEIRRVLDKAKLGKIDAVIGQKRKLDIEVSDLSSGRYPAELHGKLWEQGLIGDDEEFWPFQGEYWKDEYEGWR